jgi:hypothetical protein
MNDRTRLRTALSIGSIQLSKRQDVGSAAGCGIQSFIGSVPDGTEIDCGGCNLLVVYDTGLQTIR